MSRNQNRNTLLSESALRAVARGRRYAQTRLGRRVREAAGLSVAELAEAVGVDPGTVRRWETGERLPRREEAVRYGRLLDVLRHEVALDDDDPR